jgi:hypothetical protein
LNFQLFVNTTISLLTAFVLGGLIGRKLIGRDWRRRR